MAEGKVRGQVTLEASSSSAIRQGSPRALFPLKVKHPPPLTVALSRKVEGRFTDLWQAG